MKKKAYTFTSVVLSTITIVAVIMINYRISLRYLSLDGKTKLFFGIIEAIDFYYKYYFIGLGLAAVTFASIGARKQESKMMIWMAFVLAILSLVWLFLPIWKLMIR